MTVGQTEKESFFLRYSVNSQFAIEQKHTQAYNAKIFIALKHNSCKKNTPIIVIGYK